MDILINLEVLIYKEMHNIQEYFLIIRDCIFSLGN